MAKPKRYYWLKLKENFFEDDTLSWLEDQENGKDYCLFYLKLCLKSLKDNGFLVRYVGERLMPYDAKSLAKITRTSIDTVAVALEIFKNIGLIDVMDSGEIYVSQIEEMIGSETDSAERMRKARAKDKAIRHNVRTMLPGCDMDVQKSDGQIELEKELDLESDIDIDIEKKQKSAPKLKSQLLDEFDDWWKAYPKKRGVAKARKSYIKLRKVHSKEDLFRARDNYIKERDGKDIQYTMSGSSFLGPEKAGWEDYVDWEPEDRGIDPEVAEMFGFDTPEDTVDADIVEEGNK